MTLCDCGAKRAVDAQADHDEESRFNPQRNHVPGHIFSVGKGRSGAVDGVTPAPLVIPAKAGILTRVALDEGRAVVVNCAGILSKHISYAKHVELCALKSLMWIRAMGDSKRP